MRFLKLIFIVALLFIGFKGQSQVIVPEKDNEFDKKYTPGQNSIFNNLNKKKSESNSGDIEIKNSIKFCPTMIFRQKVGFFYEREILKGIAINFGLGKAFGEDVFEQLFLSTFSELYTPNTITAGDLLVNATHDGGSPFIQSGLRLYYSGNIFEDGYVEISHRFEKMDYILDPKVDGYRVEGSRNISFKMNAFSFGFGHTFVGGSKNNITHDLFVNFGMKLYTYPQYDRIEISNPFGSSETVYRRTSFELSARILPAINFGYAFGFGF